MTKRNYFFLFVSVALMGVIFWFSSRTAVQSNAQSDGFISLFLSRFLPDGVSSSLVTLVRKGAHFAIYSALGGSLFLGLERKDASSLGPFCSAVVLSLFYAATDELHQVFVPGRAGRLFDICVDGAGALFGCAFCFCVLLILRRIKKVRFR